MPFNLRYVALQQERDLKEYTLVPVFHLHLDQMQYRGLLSNNPWKGSISANIELLEWSVNSSVMSREESNSFQRLPCISLPNLSAMVKFEQSSTVGKYVGKFFPKIQESVTSNYNMFLLFFIIIIIL